MTFSSVHDSYWTHAGSVERMNAIIRETFISLHSSPILEKLREEVSLDLSTRKKANNC